MPDELIRTTDTKRGDLWFHRELYRTAQGRLYFAISVENSMAKAPKMPKMPSGKGKGKKGC